MWGAGHSGCQRGGGGAAGEQATFASKKEVEHACSCSRRAHQLLAGDRQPLLHALEQVAVLDGNVQEVHDGCALQRGVGQGAHARRRCRHLRLPLAGGGRRLRLLHQLHGVRDHRVVAVQPVDCRSCRVLGGG